MPDDPKPAAGPVSKPATPAAAPASAKPTPSAGPEFVPAPETFVKADPAPVHEPEPPVVLSDAQAQSQGLIKVRKDGEVLHISPRTLEAHRAAGWVVMPYPH